MKRGNHVLFAPLWASYLLTCSQARSSKERRVKRGQARKASRGSLVLWAYQGLVEKRALQAAEELTGSRESLDQGDTVERMGKRGKWETKGFQVLGSLVLKEKRAIVVCATHQRLAVDMPMSRCLEALVNQALQDHLGLLDLELTANRVHRVLRVLKEKREREENREIKDSMALLELQVCQESQD